MADWTVAHDDVLNQRLRCCSDCGRPTTTVWVGIVTLRSGFGVGYGVCARCRAKEGGEDTLKDKMRTRYCGRD